MANLLSLSKASGAIFEEMIARLYVLSWIEENEIFNQGCSTSTWLWCKQSTLLDGAVATRSLQRREEVRDVGLSISHARACSGMILAREERS